MRVRITIGILLLMLPSMAPASEDLLQIEILSYPEKLPAGLGREVADVRGLWEGWAQVNMKVRVTYVGNEPLPVVEAPFDGYRSGMFSVWARVRDENGEEVRSCVCPAAFDVVHTGIGSLAPGWTKDYAVPLCLPGVGTYVVEVVAGETIDSFKVISGEVFELWTGQSTSELIRVEVTTPKGIDKEAHDAFGPNLEADSRHWIDILQRFPGSTYAAYVILERYAKGVSNTNVENRVDSIQRGPTNESGSGLCDWEGRLDLSTQNRFSGFKYVRCRDAWVSLALKHHSDIWFADEIRLKLALDRYMLGDKDACSAGLEALADHARPYVAEKAQALLQAMQSKGMLPEASKDQPDAPAKPKPCEPTDR